MQAPFIGAELSKMNCGSCYVLLYSANHLKFAFRSQRIESTDCRLKSKHFMKRMPTVRLDMICGVPVIIPKFRKKRIETVPFFINFADLKIFTSIDFT